MIVSRLIQLAAAGAGGDSYWITTLQASDTLSSLAYDRGFALDSEGNTYATAYPNSSPIESYLVKLNNEGSLVWQRAMAGTNNVQWRCIEPDGTDVYVAGLQSDTTQGGMEFFVVKFDSSGNEVWQKSRGDSANDYVDNMTTLSTGDVILVGQSAQTGDNGAFLKYGSDGTFSTGKRYYEPSGSASIPIVGVGRDSSDNIYAIGSGNALSTRDGYVIKLNSSLTQQWLYRLGNNGEAQYFRDAAVDSSGNIHVVGDSRPSDIQSVVAKINSSGTLQWQRRLSAATAGTDQEIGYGIALDPDGNVYTATRSTDAGAASYAGVIVKYNSSGTLQWQRKLEHSDPGNAGLKMLQIRADSTSVYVYGWVDNASSRNEIYVAKLPNDGSLTGTYGNFTYSASSYTDSAESFSYASTAQYANAVKTWTDNAAVNITLVSNNNISATTTSL